MVKMKAVNLQSSKEFVLHKFGEDALRKVIDALQEEDKVIIDRPRIVVTEWIPLDTWIHFFEGIVRELNHGDESIMLDAGRHNAEKELNSIYRVFLKAANPESIVKYCPIFLKLYFNSDENNIEMSTTKVAENKYVFLIKNFETRHRLLELGVQGWLQRAFELSRAKNLNVELTKSLGQRNRCFEYTVSWG
ncbi:MAG: hypothetical protein GY853_07060 [PVC group bacterium]|nr:hypothetical protein [PVC group bacterium]